MKIRAKAEIREEIFELYQDDVKLQLAKEIGREITKHIEPEITKRTEYNTDYVLMETVFYALTFYDIYRLKELCKKYTELSDIIRNIVVDV